MKTTASTTIPTPITGAQPQEVIPALDEEGAIAHVIADIPEKKSDLVAGQYLLPAPAAEITVAVKITDMLGEEVFVTHKV